jgi:uncharacterized membrane protein YdjX (TVP38/TMEM64 family)
LLAAHLPT